VKSLSNLADLHDLNQDYRLSGLHISGHSDTDSMNVHLRNHRIGSHGERPMSLHVGAMAPSLQLPSKHRVCIHKYVISIYLCTLYLFSR